MVKKTLTRALACLALLTLVSSTLLAQDSLARRPQSATTRNSSSVVHHPAEKVPANCKKIFSNFGPPGDLYDADNGYFVSGIDNSLNAQKQDIALPFTPKVDSTVIQVKLPLQYYGYGFNGATVSIYSDASGLPGSPLAGATKNPINFQDFGSGCCDLSVAWFPSGVKLTGGTQYWIVGTTSKKSENSVNTWDFIYNDAAITFAFQQDDGGWLLITQSEGVPGPAGAVYGTTP
ncbi:MAG TPA: choice-of-anchor R domain-containing protein [Terriglobales bacterium]|nr:choice-of-anchor R domain-containing protein [Terriglobales bacterium]